MNILYVEDNEINQMVMEHALPDHTIDMAVNGETAFEQVQKKVYDLIIMDINLGPTEKDGSEVMDQIRKLDEYKTCPIYALTAYAMHGDEDRFLKRGFDKYFSKPIDFKQLEETIQALSKS